MVAFIFKMKFNMNLRFLTSFIIYILLPHVLSAVSISANETISIEEPCPVTYFNCNCTGESFYRLSCKNIRDVGILQEIGQNITGRTVILELDELNFRTFPLEVLENYFLVSMIIKKSNFETLFNFSFPDVKNYSSNIHHLSLENVTANQWSWNQLSFLKNLNILSVYNTSIGHNITFSFSEHMSKALKLLSISGSNISSIERNSFKEMLNLTYLRISHSKLRTLTRNIFPPESSLEQLKLDHNQITSLSNNTFQNMPNLTLVSLSNNRISSLPEEVYRPLWRPGMHLEIRSNPIKCDCHMRWIFTTPNRPEIIGKCAKPKHLHGRNIADLTIADLTCRRNSIVDNI